MRIRGWLLAGVMLSTAASASAQEVSEEDPRMVEARAHFDAGTARFQRRLYGAAAESFAACHEIMRSVGHPRAYLALYNWARALEEGGVLVGAADMYQRYLDEGRVAAGDQLENATEVEARVRDLRQRARMSAEASGGSSQPGSANPDGGLIAAAAVSYALAGAGLVTLGIAGGIGLGEYESLRAECGAAGTCEEARVSNVQTLAAIADVGLAVGAVGAAIGTTLLVIALTSAGPESEQSSVALAPIVGLTHVGVLVGGRF